MGRGTDFSLPTAPPLGPGPWHPPPCLARAQCQPLFPGQPVSAGGAICNSSRMGLSHPGQVSAPGKEPTGNPTPPATPTRCKPGRPSPEAEDQQDPCPGPSQVDLPQIWAGPMGPAATSRESRGGGSRDGDRLSGPTLSAPELGGAPISDPSSLPAQMAARSGSGQGPAAAAHGVWASCRHTCLPLAPGPRLSRGRPRRAGSRTAHPAFAQLWPLAGATPAAHAGSAPSVAMRVLAPQTPAQLPWNLF